MKKLKDRRIVRELKRGLKEGDKVTVIHQLNCQLTEFSALVEKIGRTRGRIQAMMRDYENHNRIMKSWYALTPDNTAPQGFSLMQHFANIKIPFINMRIYLYPDNEYFEKDKTREYSSLDEKLRNAGL